MDNVTIPLTGSGDSTAIVATDDIGGGVQIQRMKVAFGVGGTADDVTAANPLPIAAQNPLDYDTGGGTVVQGLVGIALPASGGPVGVSATNPLPIIVSAGAAVIGHVITDTGSTTAVTGNVATTAADASNVTLGAKADAKSTATDTTPITAMSVWKQISASVQALVTGTVLAAGSAIVGKFGIDQTTPGTTNAVVPTPDTTSGWTVAMMTSADGSTALTNSAQAIKASAGKLGGWYIYNPNAVATYVLIYNVAAASVTVGTTNPAICLCLPATSAANVEFAMGIPFSNAGWSAAAATTGPGNGAPSTALEANFLYK